MQINENLSTHAVQVDFSSKLNQLKNAFLKRVNDKDIISLTFFSLSGDGRNDTPGHCAKYCTYTVVELTSIEILACIVVDKRETKLVSVTMEVDALKRVLNFLMEENLNVVEVVTDAHSSVTKWLSELRSICIFSSHFNVLNEKGCFKHCSNIFEPYKIVFSGDVSKFF